MSLSARVRALAQAIGADIKALVAGKVDKVPGKGLSANDFTDDEKAKLQSLNAATVAVGVDQQWQDMLAHREAGTPYNNGTGRTVTVSVVRSVGPGHIQLTVSGMIVQREASSDPESQGTVSAIIPPGATYIIYSGSGIDSWAELRQLPL